MRRILVLVLTSCSGAGWAGVGQEVEVSDSGAPLMEMDSALIGAGGSTISASGIGGAIGPIQRGGSSVLTTADAGQDGTVTAVATGGSLGRGGSSESGSPDGVSAAGGAIGAGGAIAVGGFVAAGGVPGIGGSRSVGGALNAGGAVAAGGASVGGSNAGGASGAGGNSLSIVTCCIALQSTCTCVQVPQVACDAYVSAGYTRVSSCSGGAGGSSGTGGSYGAGGSPGGLSCSTSNTYPLTMNCARSRVGSAGMVVCSSGKLDCYPVGTSAPTIVSCSFNDFTSFGYPFTCGTGPRVRTHGAPTAHIGGFGAGPARFATRTFRPARSCAPKPLS